MLPMLGGSAIVYAAYDQEQQYRVAIKEFCPHHLDCQRHQASQGNYSINVPKEQQKEFDIARQKFWKEALDLAKFSHSQIVIIHDQFDENGTAYIVMEWVEGMLLRNYATQCKDWKEAVHLIRSAAVPLQYLHDHGLIHQDITPNNLMVMPDKTIKIIDFGGLRRTDRASSMSIIATPGFAAPEQYFEESKLRGPWTDVYSLAEVLKSLLVQGNSRPISDVPNIPLYVVQAIAQATQGEITKRPQNLTVFLDQLNPSGASERTHTGGTTMPPPNLIPKLPLSPELHKRHWSANLGQIILWIVGLLVAGFIAVVGITMYG
jgi:serine/threonine protein kinase